VTSKELATILMEREDSMQFDTLSDRIAASLQELPREESDRAVELMLEVAMSQSRGDVAKFGRLLLMAGLEAGRELERRV
jgi:hypothetical protein